MLQFSFLDKVYGQCRPSLRYKCRCTVDYTTARPSLILSAVNSIQPEMDSNHTPRFGSEYADNYATRLPLITRFFS